MSKNRSGSFIGGLLLGTALGAVTGILIAPRKGRETRQLLKKSADALPELAEDLSTSMQIQTDRLSASALRSLDGTLKRLREAMNAGLEAAQFDPVEQTPSTPEPLSKDATRDSNNAISDSF